MSSLPEVAGRRVVRGVEYLEKCARVCIEEEQARALPDNALIGVLADAVRLCRQYQDDTAKRESSELECSVAYQRGRADAALHVINESAHAISMHLQWGYDGRPTTLITWCERLARRVAELEERAAAYRESMFSPLSPEEVKQLVAAMTATGIPAPSDRLHAGWARLLLKGHA